MMLEKERQRDEKDRKHTQKKQNKIENKWKKANTAHFYSSEFIYREKDRKK